MYLSDLFISDNRIDKLTASEKKAMHSYLKKTTSIDSELIAWINSFKILNEDNEFQYVSNLGDDICDGVILLKLLSECKSNCVDWSSSTIRLSSNIRHKFDKLANCNMVKKICDESFGDVFSLIGFGGNDIVDQNPKYIRSLLSQLSRYHSTKLFAKVLFQKQAVTDNELLIWMNNRLKVYKQMIDGMNRMKTMKQMSGAVKMKKNMEIKALFGDYRLSDCIIYCNIVSSVASQWINYEYINDENECRNSKEKKVQNAKYLITVMRRLGSENIFISAKELVQCEKHAVLAMSAAIITLAARYNEHDNLVLFAKTLDEIKQKMQKK